MMKRMDGLKMVLNQAHVGKMFLTLGNALYVGQPRTTLI